MTNATENKTLNNPDPPAEIGSSEAPATKTAENGATNEAAEKVSEIAWKDNKDIEKMDAETALSTADQTALVLSSAGRKKF